MKIKSLAVAVAAMFGASAFAAETYTAPSGATFSWSGHINQGVLLYDDGQENYEEYVDNGHSQSRLRFRLGQDYGDNRLEFYFETSMGFRRTFDFSQDDRPEFIQWDKSYLRHVDLSYKTPLGKFYVGQGSMATDGAAESDLSGTFLVNYSSIGDTAGGYQLRESSGALSGISIFGAFDSFDSGRRGRIRYDTPSWNGLSASASAGTNILSDGNDTEYYDGALRYDNEFGDIQLSSALAVANIDPKGDDNNTTDLFGSVSALHESGWNGTFAFGDRVQGDGGEYLYAKVGYIADWWSVGKTAMAVDIFDGYDQAFKGASSNAYGAGIVQNFDNQNIEAYAGLRHYQVDGGPGYEDSNSYLMGARWKF